MKIMIKDKRGFMMWADFLKGLVAGFLIGAALLVLFMMGIIPSPVDFCMMLCG